MLSLKLSAVQRVEVSKTASDLCVMTRVDQNTLVSPHPSQKVCSTLPAPQGWWTNSYPSISFPSCGDLSVILWGCILAVWPIFINTSLSHLQARCNMALRDMEGRAAIYKAYVSSMHLVEVTTAWVVSHTNTHTRTHLYRQNIPYGKVLTKKNVWRFSPDIYHVLYIVFEHESLNKQSETEDQPISKPRPNPILRQVK